MLLAGDAAEAHALAKPAYLTPPRSYLAAARRTAESFHEM